MAFSSTKLACLLLIASAMLALTADASVTCGVVNRNVASCFPYLTGRAGPAPRCCAGVRALVKMSVTAADRKVACGCLKQTAASIRGINFGNAATLPSKCGVRSPLPISLNTDCSRIH